METTTGGMILPIDSNLTATWTGASPRGSSKDSVSVAAVIPYYNESPDRLAVTLQGLQAQSVALQEIILVDDGSSTSIDLGTTVQALELTPILLRLPRNSGISAARNFGARHTTAVYLLFINAEVELTSEWIRRVARFMEANPDAGLASGQIQPRHGRRFAEWRWHHLDLLPETRVDRTHELDWAVGHALLVRRTDFEAIGGFDERYRRAYEDVDLCSRLRNSGKKVFQVEGAIGFCHSKMGLRQLAAKKIRNLHWNLDPRYPGDPNLRPLNFPWTLKNFWIESKKSLRLHFRQRRWGVLLVESGVLVNGLYLLVASSVRRHAALNASPFGLWLRALPRRAFRKCTGSPERFAHHPKDREKRAFISRLDHQSKKS